MQQQMNLVITDRCLKIERGAATEMWAKQFVSVDFVCVYPFSNHVKKISTITHVYLFLLLKVLTCLPY